MYECVHGYEYVCELWGPCIKGGLSASYCLCLLSLLCHLLYSFRLIKLVAGSSVSLDSSSAARLSQSRPLDVVRSCPTRTTDVVRPCQARVPPTLLASACLSLSQSLSFPAFAPVTATTPTTTTANTKQHPHHHTASPATQNERLSYHQSLYPSRPPRVLSRLMPLPRPAPTNCPRRQPHPQHNLCPPSRMTHQCEITYQLIQLNP